MRSGMIIQLIAVVLCAGMAAGQPAQTIYVDAAAVGAEDGSSWSDAYRHLQDALAAASVADPPVEVRVAQGVYRPDEGAGVTPGDGHATFELPNGLTLRGGYAGAAGPDPDARDADLYATLLSGDLTDPVADVAAPPRNSHVIVTARLIDATVTLEALTVTGAARDGMVIEAGRPTIRHCRFVANGSTGLRCKGESAPVVVGCAFNENGTGMYNASGNPDVTDCSFERNERTGMDNGPGSVPALVDCRFVENGDAGIRAWACDFALTGCLFQGNSREGIDAVLSDLTLQDCMFDENGGLAIDSSGGTLDLFRCSFVANAGAVDSWRGLTARSCLFADNHGRVGAVDCNGEVTLVDCQFIGNSATTRGAGAVRAWGDTLTVSRCLFSGNSSSRWQGGAIDSFAEVMKLSNCAFVGNSCDGGGPGAVLSRGQVLNVLNCTFADNHGLPNALVHQRGANAITRLTQCILWDGPGSFEVPSSDTAEVTVTFSDIQGGYPGQGNFSVDPCFVERGYWADPDDRTLEAGPEEPNAVWVSGDYHLKSQAGHWDRADERWTFDDVTSPCIDAGDPNGPLGSEPFPNGGFVNLGAYGGTAEASRSYFGEPVCETHIAGDINGDCRVDDVDMDLMLSHWLMADIGRGNVPPTVTVVAPQDGAEIVYPQPIMLQIEASDPDGRVLRIGYSVQHHHGNGTHTAGSSTTDRTDDWVREHAWSRVHYDGVHVIWAEALDDDGAKTLSPKITVTLRR